MKLQCEQMLQCEILNKQIKKNLKKEKQGVWLFNVNAKSIDVCTVYILFENMKEKKDGNKRFLFLASLGYGTMTSQMDKMAAQGSK